MGNRMRLAIGVATITVLAGLALGPVWEFGVTVPAATAVGGVLGVLIAGQPGHRWIPHVTTFASVVTLVATITYRISESPAAAVGAALELAGLVWLIILLVRHGTRRQMWVVGALAIIAQDSQILRALVNAPGVDVQSLLGGLLMWGAGSFSAVLGGRYLRSLDERRAQAVASAQRAQRMELARDLHDFVAHDVSGIVVQAQAAQVVADQDPKAVMSALRRIEEAGLQALAAMDRTVHMLREESATDTPEAERAPVQSIADLPELVDRFTASGSTDVTLRMDSTLPDRLPREVSSTIYRLVVEALTNVRRHAPGAARVDVTISTADTGVSAVIVNSSADRVAETEPPRTMLSDLSRAGGLGLLGLTERVEALGGTLAAGPVNGSGWQVTGYFPFADGADRSQKEMSR